MFGCVLIVAAIATQAPASTISRVDVSPRVLDVAERDEARIRFYVSEPARVTVDLFDQSDNRLWTAQRSFQRGYGQFLWGAKTADKRMVPDGVYTFALTTDTGFRYAGIASAESRSVAVYDVGIDHSKGLVSYNLSEPARVEVRLGVGNGGPLLRTMDTFQAGGRQVVRWDGWDESRVVNLLGDDRVLASVRAVALPENSLVVRDAERPAADRSAPFQIRFSQRKTGKPGELRQVLTAEVRFDGDVNTVVGNDRCEWIFFVDQQFVFEEEKAATNPYVFEFDITSLAKGDHVLTVNLAGLESNLVRSCSGRFTVGP